MWGKLVTIAEEKAEVHYAFFPSIFNSKAIVLWICSPLSWEMNGE